MTQVRTIIVVVLMMCAFLTLSYFDHNYTLKECIVTEASDEGALIKDCFGEMWFYEGEGFKAGQNVEMKMHDNFTTVTNLDDEIKEVIKR